MRKINGSRPEPYKKITGEKNLTLPWPPTINTYWRRVGNRTLISKRGRAYREAVRLMAINFPRYGSSRLRIEIDAWPPDRRRRDLDNLTKALFDSLEDAGIFDDDSQIDQFTITRRDVERGGLVELRITEL